MNRFLFLVCCALFCIHTVTYAQNAAVDVAITAIPTNPIAGETVTLSLTSYSADIAQASISWTYNGRVFASGIGKTTVALVAPASGATGTVVATVSSTGLESGSASLILRPGSFDMLWEAVDAYVPPFYKGKALLSVGGAVRVSAIAAPTVPRNLSYTWSKNGSALQSLSGYNKSSIAFRHNPLDTTTRIGLTAASGAYGASAELPIVLTDPRAIAYKTSNGFIDFAHGYTDTVPFRESGAIIRIEPYYFSVVRNSLADLSLTASIDGQTLASEVPNEFALSRPEGGGSSKLEIAIATVVYSLQNLTKTFTLAF
jgi:hypothetical protein